MAAVLRGGSPLTMKFLYAETSVLDRIYKINRIWWENPVILFILSKTLLVLACLGVNKSPDSGNRWYNKQYGCSN